MGRHNNELIRNYTKQCNQKLSDSSRQRLADNVYISLFRGLSLKEYVSVRTMDCHSRHTQPCFQCAALTSVANRVEQEGHIRLSTAFKMAFPSQAYKADIARQRMLQMPLACIRVGKPESGTAAWFLVEYVEGVNYINFAHFAEALFSTRAHSHAVGIGRGEIKSLLGLAQSDRERELIRCSIFKTSGLSSSASRRQFGFEECMSGLNVWKNVLSLLETYEKLSTSSVAYKTRLSGLQWE